MKRLYELIENIRDIVAKKLLCGYSLRNVYKAVTYAMIYAALQIRADDYELLNPLAIRIPPPLLAAARRELIDKMHSLIKNIVTVLSENKPVLVHGEADFEYVINAIKSEVGEVDCVLVYDCMSLIEQIVISAFLEAKGMKTLFLSTFFINPIGMTKFVTSQLPDTRCKPSLFGVAEYVANQLGALLYMKSSLIDKEVHERGLLGVEEFVEKLAIDQIANEILDASTRGRVLLFSDHGYDIVLSRQERYLYITHGFKERSYSSDTLLLPLSRVIFFVKVYSMGSL